MGKRAERCKKCNKELTSKQVWRKQQYCSRECFANARWGEKMRFETLETRRPLVIEAAKLCQAGFTQTAAAEMLGVHPRMVGDWFDQYGADNFLPGRVCEHCKRQIKQRYAEKSAHRQRFYSSSFRIKSCGRTLAGCCSRA